MTGSSCLYFDTDNDGLSDSNELVLGTSPVNSDYDGDGMPDGWEVLYSLDPTSPDDAGSDADGDLFSNLEEAIAGTSPRDAADYLEAQAFLLSPTNLSLEAQSVRGGIYEILSDADFMQSSTSWPVHVAATARLDTVEFSMSVDENETNRYFRLKLHRP